MNLISRESLADKSCKALNLSLARFHVALCGQAYVDPRRPHLLPIMKLHPMKRPKAMRLLLAVLKTATAALLIVATVATAQAEPRQSTERNRNYILRRQEAGLVSGVPTSRLIIGKREIDIYRNGLMFEGDHVVGVRGTR